MTDINPFEYHDAKDPSAPNPHGAKDANGQLMSNAHLAYSMALGDHESARAAGAYSSNPADNERRAAVNRAVRKNLGI
jgi:hypothetical protein